MIELHINHTGKGYSPRDEYRMIHSERLSFRDMAAAKAWIRERYGKAKRRPIYRDTKNGDAIKVGYIIGYRDADLSHYPVNKWLAQDWIEFVEIEPRTPEGI